MAINLGLVEGTSRGIAREADWKFRDHSRSMAREESQLEKIIATTKYNKEQRYLRERNARADFESDRTFGLRANADKRAQAAEDRNVYWDEKRRERYPTVIEQEDERHQVFVDEAKDRGEAHDIMVEESEYQKGRRSFREKAEQQEYDYRGQLIDQGKDKHEDWQKTRKDYWERLPVERKQQDELFGQQKDLNEERITGEQLRNREMRRGSKTRQEYKTERDANLALTWSQIKANKARSEGTTPKYEHITTANAEKLGRSVGYLDILTAKGKRPLNDLNKFSIMDATGTAGQRVGQILAEQEDIRYYSDIDLRRAANEAWRGILTEMREDNNGNRFTVGSKLFDGVPAEQRGAVLEQVRERFVNSVVRSARGRGQGAAGGGVSPSDLGNWTPDGGVKGEYPVYGPHDTHRSVRDLALGKTEWGKDDIDFTPDGTWMRWMNKMFSRRGDQYYKRQEWMTDEFMDEQVDDFLRTGDMDWDTVETMSPDKLLPILFNKIMHKGGSEAARQFKEKLSQHQGPDVIF